MAREPGSGAEERRPVRVAQGGGFVEAVLFCFFILFYFPNKFSFKVVYLRLKGTRALLGCGTRAPCGCPRPHARLQLSGSVWDNEPDGLESSWWDVAGHKAPTWLGFPQNHSPPASILLHPFSSGVFGAEPRARHHHGPIPSQHARPSGVFALLEDPNQLFWGLGESGWEQSKPPGW